VGDDGDDEEEDDNDDDDDGYRQLEHTQCLQGKLLTPSHQKMRTRSTIHHHHQQQEDHSSTTQPTATAVPIH